MAEQGPYADPGFRFAAKRGIGEEERGVKYIRDAMRLERYRITMEHALLRGRKDGVKTRFDTAEIKRHFMGKRPGGRGDWEKAGQKGAPLGTAAMRAPLPRGLNWFESSLIWVCVPTATDTVFYSHVGKISRFHHSSFVCGGDVLGAGEWIVEQGKIRTVAAVSGHYQPTLTSLVTCVRIMIANHGNDFDVLLYHIGQGWQLIPARLVGTDSVSAPPYCAFPADPG